MAPRTGRRSARRSPIASTSSAASAGSTSSARPSPRRSGRSRKTNKSFVCTTSLVRAGLRSPSSSPDAMTTRSKTAGIQISRRRSSLRTGSRSSSNLRTHHRIAPLLLNLNKWPMQTRPSSVSPCHMHPQPRTFWPLSAASNSPSSRLWTPLRSSMILMRSLILTSYWRGIRLRSRTRSPNSPTIAASSAKPSSITSRWSASQPRT